MAIDTIAGFVEAVGRARLLSPAQLDELTGVLHARYPEPQALARELLRRGWLTAYQIDQLLHGQGADLLLGSYVILERLGEGGMGEVFKARNWKLNRIVALKRIHKQRLADSDIVRRFRREMRAAAQLVHPNIVRAFDADEVGGTHFFVMEYIEGTNLSRWVKQHGPPPVAQACDFVRQAALGLQHAFEHGLVHRDIKPANLLLTFHRSGGPEPAQAVVKLLDLGLAHIAQDADDESGDTLTKEGSVVGTPDYVSPEQALDSHTVDTRADLYSLGCTFYYLLTGSVPFPGGTAMEKLLRHRLEQPWPVEARRPEVPATVAAVVRTLLAKQPEARYQTPGELAEVLASLVAGGFGEPELSTLTESSSVPATPDVTQSVSKVPFDQDSIQPIVQLARGGQHLSTAEKKRRVLVLAGVLSGMGVLGLLLVLLPGAPGPEAPVPRAKEPPRARPVPFVRPEPQPVDAVWLRDVAVLPAGRQLEEVIEKLRDLNGRNAIVVTPVEENGVVTGLELSTDQVTDLSPLRALTGLKRLKCQGTYSGGFAGGKLATLAGLQGLALTSLDCSANPALTDLAPLAGMPLVHLDCTRTTVVDLTPLQRMPLEDLTIYGTRVADLSPLKGLALRALSCGDTPVRDLSPLHGMSLRTLGCSSTQVSDLSPLKDMPLVNLVCLNIPTADLSPLKSLRLEHLQCTYNPWRGDAEVLRAIPSLAVINKQPAATFRQEMDAWRTEFDQWCNRVAGLAPAEQLQEVTSRFQKDNRGIGKLFYPKVEGEVVTELRFSSMNMRDLTGVRAMPGLRRLTCDGPKALGVKGPLRDLWPLRGLKLTVLSCRNTEVSDLAPLAGMPLTELNLSHTAVRDLTPLRGMALKVLDCRGTAVTDLSPLSGMPLEKLHCEVPSARAAEVLRAIPTLKTINDEDTAAFLKKHRGGAP